MVTGDYFYINDCEVLGKFYVHYGRINDHPNKACLRTCLKLDVELNKKLKFIPGYLTYERHFIACPLSAVYVQINSLDSVENDSTKLLANLMVFSNDYKSYVNLNVTIFTHREGDFMSINNYINAINSYVAGGNAIQHLNDQIFAQRINFKMLDEYKLIDLINNLEISFFSNDFRRVGKDNSFWDETQIGNLPKSKYLTSCILESLKHAAIFENLNINSDFFIIGCSNYSKAWSPASGREKLPDDEFAALKIKDFIKLHFFKVYDPTKEFNERLIITS